MKYLINEIIGNEYRLGILRSIFFKYMRLDIQFSLSLDIVLLSFIL